MILPDFDVLVPESLDQACRMLDEHGPSGARLLAGGTDLLVDLRRPIIPQHVPRCDGCPHHPEGNVRSTVGCAPEAADPFMPEHGSIRATLTDKRLLEPAFLVSLHRLSELKGIERRPDGSLRVGALTTISEIERSDVVRAHWAALAEGAFQLGSPLVRNRGTIGGNIANARPAADTAIPTVALGGQIVLRSVAGTRYVAAAEFARGPGLSVLKPDEILIEVVFPPPVAHSGSAYYKLANRKALEISTVGVAVWLALEHPGGPVADVRVALGAVGPTPLLAETVHKELVGKRPDDDALRAAARAARHDARPINDHRGSAWYRTEMVEVLTHRLLAHTVRTIGPGA